MFWAGVFLLVFGVAWSAFKGWLVWDVSHDLYHGGGVPTLDYVVACPIPLALGTGTVASALGVRPFPGFGFAVYVGLVVVFAAIHWWFDRLGEPERERQLREIERRT